MIAKPSTLRLANGEEMGTKPAAQCLSWLKTGGTSHLCQRRKSPLLFDHLFATGEHLDAIVIPAARLAAILLRVAEDIRHADKGQHVFEIRNT
jgi:streptomycin 6-kinase